MLAHHYARTHHSDKVVLHLSLAAKKSLRVFSLAEAQAYLDQALTRIEAQPACANDTLLAEIVVDRLLVCCWPISSACSTSPTNIVCDWKRRAIRASCRAFCRGLARLLFNATRFRRGRAYSSRARGIGEALRDEECIAYAMWDQMWLYTVTPEGRPLNAIAKMGERVLQAAERLRVVSRDPDVSPAQL